MIDFESTFEEKPEIHYCVIYDSRSGAIVSNHGFVGDGTGLFGPEGQEERARIALDGAKQRHPSKNLRVIHAPDGFRFDPDQLYRVDVRTSKIVSIAAEPTRGKA